MFIINQLLFVYRMSIPMLVIINTLWFRKMLLELEVEDSALIVRNMTLSVTILLGF